MTKLNIHQFPIRQRHPSGFDPDRRVFKVPGIAPIPFQLLNNEIVGTNGSGQTPLLKILSTLSLPTSGSIYIDGKSSYKIIQKTVGSLNYDPVGMLG